MELKKTESGAKGLRRHRRTVPDVPALALDFGAHVKGWAR